VNNLASLLPDCRNHAWVAVARVNHGNPGGEICPPFAVNVPHIEPLGMVNDDRGIASQDTRDNLERIQLGGHRVAPFFILR
jgi:hypothetical protein